MWATPSDSNKRLYDAECSTVCSSAPLGSEMLVHFLLGLLCPDGVRPAINHAQIIKLAGVRLAETPVKLRDLQFVFTFQLVNAFLQRLDLNGIGKLRVILLKSLQQRLGVMQGRHIETHTTELT